MVTKTSDRIQPLHEIGVALCMLAVAYLAWSLGVGAWITALSCGDEPYQASTPDLLEYSACVRDVGNRALNIGAIAIGLLGAWFIRRARRRDAAAEARRDVELDAEMKRIRDGRERES